MNNKQTKLLTTLISRRTGIDRRWIPSSDHQPERRRGMDRRSVKRQAQGVLPELSAAGENQARFPEINDGIDNRKEKSASVQFERKGFSPLPDTMSKGESPSET